MADNPEFKVLSKNLTRDKEACIEAGMILGHFEVLNADVEVKALRVSGTPADAVDLAGKDVNGDATHTNRNEPSTQFNQIATLNTTGELNKRFETELDEREEGSKIHTEEETPQVDSPSDGEGVPRSIASPTSPRRDPASAVLVTQERRVHTPDEVGDNPYQGVALRGGHSTDVAWQDEMQPEVWSSRDVRGTREECQSRGTINHQNEEEPQVATNMPQVATNMPQVAENSKHVVMSAVNRTLRVEPELGQVQQPHLAADTPTVSAVTPVAQTQHDTNQRVDKESRARNDDGDEDPKPKPSDDQHEWDELTFRQRVEAALLAQKVDIDDTQRAQLIELLCKHKHLWIAKQSTKRLTNTATRVAKTRCFSWHQIWQLPGSAFVDVPCHR